MISSSGNRLLVWTRRSTYSLVVAGGHATLTGRGGGIFCSVGGTVLFDSGTNGSAAVG